jgi:ethanolamine kinase
LLLTAADFEYSAYNPRGFDFANHWNEYAGFDSDFENKYPRDELQRKFMEAYLKASWPEILAQSKKEDMLGALCRAANRYSVASHLFWGMWAVIQSKYSPIDFDFLNYARLRFVGYEAHCKWLSE